MEKTYQPSAIEQQWYNTWETKQYFCPKGEGKPYCIMIPPPNVTGSLHMGHAFQYTLMDTLIRYHRMCGDKTLWQVGSDHAGIATQMVVERQLAAEGKKRTELGRDKFLDKVWEWKQHSGNRITEQMRRMGISVDWSRERFTMDDGLSNAVQEVFIRLYEEDLIYRGKRLVNWDPTLHTAISDLEVISQEEQGSLWYFRYPIVDSNDYLVIATTRPETMLGDTAIAVNPNDDRYQHLVGKQVKLPLTERTIPIIADDYVDPEFGTGCVKITPAHDFNDYVVGVKHHLPLINIFTIDAALNENVPTAYQGLDRFVARKQIVAELEKQGLLDKITDHKLMVPRGDRSGVVIEPYLTDQWYVKIEPLATPAMDAVTNGDINFVPKKWENTYFSWMRDIQDWCISRQLWWGHRIPAWYDKEGNIFVGYNEESVREKYQLENSTVLHQDEDVLDTWFSSALWTFSTLGWPDKTLELNTFHPTNVLVTGFDIIFFWIARMIMMTLKFTNQVPFEHVYIHGLVRDAEGQKMSKSKGNVLDPIDLIDGIALDDLIEKNTKALMQPGMAKKIGNKLKKQYPDGIPAFGTDALRFTFCALASTGRDINFDLNRITGYRNFCNKLWNAARYVLMNTEDQDCGTRNNNIELSTSDRWIISVLQLTEEKMQEYINAYRFDHAAQTIYEFVWNEYCDWYLELVKPILNNNDSSEAQLRGTRQTLVRVLESILRLAHPIIPFITEEIWQKIAPLASKQGESIMLQPYPQADNNNIDDSATADIDWLKSVIVAIRNIRGEMNISPAKMITIYFNNGDSKDKERLNNYNTLLSTLAKIDTIQWLSKQQKTTDCATGHVDNLEIFIPMAGLIDKEAEIQRLKKALIKLEKDLSVVCSKLDNDSFVSNAPNEVVKKTKQQRDELKQSEKKVKSQLDMFNQL